MSTYITDYYRMELSITVKATLGVLKQPGVLSINNASRSNLFFTLCTTAKILHLSYKGTHLPTRSQLTQCSTNLLPKSVDSCGAFEMPLFNAYLCWLILAVAQFPVCPI